MMQVQAHALHRLKRTGEDAVVEDNESMVTNGAGIAQGIRETDFGRTIRGQIFDQ